eukprot:Tamp_07957.p1 GENE.Tamp_07957~~Tamp_07957.p1  ORF type:complete len:650 (-),score=56.84 Tamp_07957:338-2287(-)
MMSIINPTPGGHRYKHSVTSVAAAFKNIDKPRTKWLLSVLALAVAAIVATNSATIGVTSLQDPLWDNMGSKEHHLSEFTQGYRRGKEVFLVKTATALKDNSTLGQDITLEIESLVVRNSFNDPVADGTIVDINITPKIHPLQVPRSEGPEARASLFRARALMASIINPRGGVSPYVDITGHQRWAKALIKSVTAAFMKIYKDDATSGSLSRRMEELVLASVGTVVVKTAVSVATGLTRRGPATRAAAARTRRVDSVLYVVLLAAQLGSVQAWYACTESSHCQYDNCKTSYNGRVTSRSCTSGSCRWTAGANGYWCDDPPACIAGKFSPEGGGKDGGGSYACRPCPPGTFGTQTGASSSATCTSCPAGSYSTFSGASSCTSCPVGSYSTFSGASSSATCTSCPAGSYSVSSGANSSSTCIPRCGPGFFSTTTGEAIFISGTCQPCPRNSFSTVGSSSLANCTCAPGFFGPAGGPCSSCPTGTYKSTAGSAASCTPCPVVGQWSPTRSVSPDDCMVIPTPTVSEACPRTPVEHFNEPRFKRCQTPWTWDDLYDGYKESTIDYYQGSLGTEAVTGMFETYACIRADPCALGPTDYFCYVYHEVNDRFVPWGSNTVLQIVPITSQDEVLHLRAEVNKLKAALQALNATLIAKP